MNDPKDVELHPKEWRSERDKPREPFFGKGLPGGLAYLAGFIVMFTVIYYATH
jgi:hypothetical protein